MNLLLPLLLLAADTGGITASVTGGARGASTVSDYVKSDLNVESGINVESDINRYSPKRMSPDRWFGPDKFRHAAMSYLITAGTAGAARTIADRDDSVLIGAAIGAAAGIAKEIYDRKSSTRDLVWDLAGIAAAVLIMRNAR